MEYTAPIDVEREIEMKRKKAEYMKQYRLKRKLGMEQRASNVKLQVESDDEYKIPSIFNDESTGSCICLRLDLYMSHVNKL
jgi:hypothetical protein